MTEKHKTGATDTEYNMVSVLYHALNGANSCEKYIQDCGDEKQLSDFFHEVQDNYRSMAEKAKHMLKSRI